MNDQNYSFEKEWKEVDQLESKGLPKSSLEVIDSIYKTAKASNNEVQMLNAFIRKNTSNIEIQEDAIDSLYLNYFNEILSSTNTNASILKSILAESLNSYLQQNMWQIQERTPLAENNVNQAIQTWDIRRFHEEIQKLYLSSVYDLKDRTVQTSKYNALIANPSTEYLLSIYDLLLYRASEFFKSSNSHITEPVYKFTLNKAEYFSSNSEFSKINITTKDTSSSIFQALLLFQDGIKHHLITKNENALIDLDIRRIEFLNQNAIIPNKQELYLKALDQLITSYPNNPELLRVYYLKAISYYSEGNQYNAKNKTGNANGFIEAMQVIETANKKYGGVSEQLGDLKSVIQQKHLEFDIEAINIPDKPILLKCKVKNLDKVYAKIIPISNKEYFEYVSEQNYQNKQKKIELFISKKGLITNSFALKKMDDYQFHETEMMLNPLKTGNYIVAFCEQPEFKSNQIFTTKLIQISKIAWFFRDNKQVEKEFSLVDRETGQQLKNVKATIYQWLYDNRENKFNKISNFVSDKNGKIIIPQQKNNSYLVEFINGKDSLFTEYNYYNYENYYRNDYHKNIFLFTDRSIYRPGQIVYFKGIVANREILPKVATNEPIEISLKDANYQVVSKLRLNTNDFGSFNGSFVLPNSGLTGNFTIDCFGITQIIRVEEYKRPTFEAKFDPTEGSYQLGESITFKGKAIGYTGSALNDATVKYRITRKKDYPYWPWWYSRWIPNRNSAAVEIDNGVLQTQPDGSFEVKFVAKADDVVDKDKPRFQFEITADVTDITGETHAAKTSIYVCEIPFVINSNIEEKLDKNKDNNWHISTANHNNQVMKTTVKLKVYSLIQPKTTFINRMWEAPEYQVLTKSEFQKNFPNFSYDGEEFEYNWKKRQLSF
ncbi:MAG: hypothetical protein IPL95_07685 [Saprospiraceae bacterium]|nr:hypothetical protein [Saprospiraceae bacterium]